MKPGKMLKKIPPTKLSIKKPLLRQILSPRNKKKEVHSFPVALDVCKNVSISSSKKSLNFTKSAVKGNCVVLLRESSFNRLKHAVETLFQYAPKIVSIASPSSLISLFTGVHCNARLFQLTKLLQIMAKSKINV